jgi:hypothetical protein
MYCNWDVRNVLGMCGYVVCRPFSVEWLDYIEIKDLELIGK